MTGDSDRKQIIDPHAVYSRQEAAEALGVSLSTLKKMINAGYLRVSQPAGIRRIFIKGESILAMLDQTVVERRA
jgi:excisionase family DNA binding protein